MTLDEQPVRLRDGGAVVERFGWAWVGYCHRVSASCHRGFRVSRTPSVLGVHGADGVGFGAGLLLIVGVLLVGWIRGVVDVVDAWTSWTCSG